MNGDVSSQPSVSQLPCPPTSSLSTMRGLKKCWSFYVVKKFIFHYVKALLSCSEVLLPCCTKYVAQSNGKEDLHCKLDSIMKSAPIKAKK